MKNQSSIHTRWTWSGIPIFGSSQHNERMAVDALRGVCCSRDRWSANNGSVLCTRLLFDSWEFQRSTLLSTIILCVCNRKSLFLVLIHKTVDLNPPPIFILEFLSVCRGTKRPIRDILWKWSFTLQFHMDITCSPGRHCCCSFRCAWIIGHSWKYSSTKLIIQRNAMSHCFVIWFDFMCRQKGWVTANCWVFASVLIILDLIWCVLCRFFLDSANVYRPFVLVQLSCNTVLMTITVFYIDLVSANWIDMIEVREKISNFEFYILAMAWHQLHCG